MTAPADWVKLYGLLEAMAGTGAGSKRLNLLQDIAQLPREGECEAVKAARFAFEHVGVRTPEQRCRWLLAAYESLLAKGKGDSKAEWVVAEATRMAAKAKQVQPIQSLKPLAKSNAEPCDAEVFRLAMGDVE